MSDSVVISQLYTTNESMLNILYETSRTEWLKNRWKPQEYSLQLFMIDADRLIMYISYCTCDELVNDMMGRSELFTREYHTNQKGRIAGFISCNNTIFYVVDFGVPEYLMKSLLEKTEVHRLILRPYQYEPQYEGEEKYRIWPHRGKQHYIYKNGSFEKCDLVRKTE